MKFSQRVGMAESTKLVQHESMDEDLKNSLWNLVSRNYLSDFKSQSNWGASVEYSNKFSLLSDLWSDFFKKPIDKIPNSWNQCYETIRSLFFSYSWFRVYDFIEFLVNVESERKKKSIVIQKFNDILKRENSAYRFIGSLIGEIASEQEVVEVQVALSHDKYFGVREHLTTALKLLSDRENPDYRNSIKESISAVESLAKNVTGKDKATLGGLLSDLEKKINLHSALKSSFSSLYGYTSDGSGIRHAIKDQSSISKAEARLMLVTCSAFVNYVIDSLEC